MTEANENEIIDELVHVMGSRSDEIIRLKPFLDRLFGNDFADKYSIEIGDILLEYGLAQKVE